MRYLSLALLLGFVLAFVAGCESSAPPPEKPAPEKPAAEKVGEATKEATDVAGGVLEKAADEAKKAIEEKK
jgi:hypothetical protein